MYNDFKYLTSTMSSSEKESWVWKFFIKRIDNKRAVGAKCTICKDSKELVANTSTMARHLSTIHSITVKSVHSDSGVVNVKATQKTLPFLPRKSMECLVAELAAVDGFSIRAITNSKFIRESFMSKGYNLPKCESQVMSLIHKFYNQVREAAMKQILADKQEDRKFSITLDEWVDATNRKFLNITLNRSGGGLINLGLVRIIGSCSAEKLFEAVESHLKYFGIEPSRDIVAATGDGASVMLKFGRLSPFIYQVCLNHGFHLGVTKTFYNKKKNLRNSNEAIETEVLDDNFSEDDDSIHGDDDEEFCLNEDIDEILTSVRRVVSFFRRSSLKTDLLQKKVQELNAVSTEKDVNVVDGIETLQNNLLDNKVKLQLDVKHRWNTIVHMIRIFIKYFAPIKDALVELDEEEMLDGINLETLQMLVNILAPIELAVLELGKRDANLRKAMISIEFVREKISQSSSAISEKLLENINEYIEARIDKNVFHLIESLDTASVPSNSVLKYATELMKRIFGNDETDNEHVPDNPQPTISCQNDNFSSLAKELTQRITSSSVPKTTQVKFDKLKQEFKIFKSTGNRTENLEKLRNALDTIQPTSTESERVFSVAGNFISKLRCRLSDKSVNALVFLKYYFKNPW